MRQGFIHFSAAMVFCAGIAAAGQNVAQNPPAPQAPTPASTSIEGTVTISGTSTPIKKAQVFLRSAGSATANTQLQQLLNARGGQGRGGQGRGDAIAAALESLPDLLGNLGIGAGNGAFGNLGRGALPGAAVTSTSVDSSGRFKFSGVNPGEYRIFAEGEGYLRQEHGQRTPNGAGTPIVLENDKPLEVNFKLVQGSVISGRVFDPDGDPLADTVVQAYNYTYSGGKRSLSQAATAQTNDQGQYRLFYLSPGEYFVAVNPPAGTLDEPSATSNVNTGAPNPAGFGGRGGGGRGGAGFGGLPGGLAAAFGGGALTPVYYPGVIDPRQAGPVSVSPAARVEGIDIHLRPARMVSLSGRVDAPFPLGTNQDQRAAIDQLRNQIQQGGGIAALRGQQPGQTPTPDAGGQADGQRGQRGQGGQGRGGNAQDIRGALQSVLGASAQVSLARVGDSQNPLGGLGLGQEGTRVQPDGTFSIPNVAPGTYNLTATARDQSGQEFTARTRLDVGGGPDMSGIVLSVRPGLELRGQLYVEEPPQGFKASQIRVNLVADDSPVAGIAIAFAGLAGGGNGGANGANPAAAIGGGGQIATGQVADDGSFTLKNVGALEYRVRLTGLPTGAYLKAGRIGDADPLNAPFVVTDPAAVLQIQIGFNAGKVGGAIVDAERKPVAGVVAALVPEESQRGRTDRYFSATSDRTGRVSFVNVPPGNYKLFAWEEIPAGAFQYPEFIRGFEDRGQPVVVETKGATEVEVRVIPPV